MKNFSGIFFIFFTYFASKHRLWVQGYKRCRILIQDTGTPEYLKTCDTDGSQVSDRCPLGYLLSLQYCCAY